MKKKCVLIGEHGTGKTCIIQRIMKDEYIENPDSTSSPSNSILHYEYNGVMEKLEFWDTAGQEIFRSVNKLFYKGAHLCFLVYCIDNRNTFLQLKEYWVPTINSLLGSETCFCVVANKSDLFDCKDVIDETEGKNFADEIGGSFISTSAKLGIGFPGIVETGLNSYYKKHPKEEQPKQIGKDPNEEIPEENNTECCLSKKKKVSSSLSLSVIN